MLNQRLLCLVWGFCLAAVGIAQGTVYYVDVDNGGHDGVFETPAGAATNIQSAVDLAGNGDTILIAPGRYTVGPFSGSQDSVARLINKSLTLCGTGGSPAEVRIDGEGTHRGIYYYRTVSDGSALTIENLTVTNGYHATQGSGIFLYSTKQTTQRLIDCVIEGCTTADGALRQYDVASISTHLEIVNCVFRNNETASALYTYRLGTFDIRDSRIENNNGRGINLAAGSGQISNTQIINNHAGADGGGIYINMSGDLTLFNCLIASNTCQTTSTKGGGGIYKAGAGNLSVQNCTIVTNVCFGTYGQGGIHREAGTVDLINTILWGNIRDEGTVVNYDWWSAAPYKIRSMTNTITAPLTNTISRPPVALYPDSNNIDADPLFMNAESGDYRLQRLSPAVNAGINLAWMAGAVDLDGNLRVDGMTFKVDIGAYEYQYPGTVILVR